jgi:AraC-like DNA-binding protein
MKVFKVPQVLTQGPYRHNAIQMNGFSVVESCTHTSETRGHMFLEDHYLLCVLKGTNVITHGKIKYTVRKNEMVLLKKSILIEYHKSGDPEEDNLYDSMMFFLKDEFLRDFIKMTDIETVNTPEIAMVTVRAVKLRLSKFIESIKPYFTDPEEVDPKLIRLKMLELLFDLASSDRNLLQEILQLKQQAHTDITAVVEQYFTTPVSLTDLAYLSGRSLSSFKRDFQAIYKIPPAQWIREKRLAKAKDLLLNTAMPVTDVCFSTGFENPAHFSKLFKDSFGYPPSAGRRQPVLNQR